MALAVGSPNLVPVDAAIRDRLTGLGYAVTVVDDGVATVNSLSSYDVVVVTRTVSESLGRGWSAVPRPVLLLRPWLYDDWKLTGPTAKVDFGWTTNTTSLVVQAVNHPLAASLGVGSRVVLNTAATLPFGKPTASAAVIGKHPNGPVVLFSVRAGDALIGGSTAAGCRLAYPSADGIFMNPTTAGATLFAQSLSWLQTGCP